MVSSADVVSSKLAPRDRGVLSGLSPRLEINEMTLQEHQDYLIWVVSKPRLTREEAVAVGHRPSEIEAYFGMPAPSVGSAGSEEKPVTDARGPENAPRALGAPASEPGPVILAPAPRDAFNRRAPAQIVSEPTGFDRVKARTMGYTGDLCTACASFRMVRNATCLMCQECGQTTGCS